ncbi:PD-(D/E)XK motif protein [Streptomyces sp. NPDC051771]|uniref:PD-(D/E)XK motif protein n=1 Tax=Streptomyces sp. NPDC051771 TaxID=3154847 RepID=UPI00341C7D62
MSEDILRSLVEARWTELEAEQPTGERRLRVSHLPIVVDHGNPLAIAVDHEGYRHVLVPIASHRKVRPGLDGPVLSLRRRPLEDEDSYQTYADLACLRSDLNDLFTELCLDVIGAAEESPENPIKALNHVLDRWKELFRTSGAPLTGERLVGLFGELIVLSRLLGSDPSAHRIWRGPSGYRHDFASAFTAVEVKSSTADEGRRPRIHGLDQLEPPGEGQLSLVWLRLARTSTTAGVRFVDLIERVLRLCDDENELLALLAAAGYHLADAERYRDVAFEVTEERWYRVTPGFPGLTARRLVAAGIPVSAMDVEFTIDLSGEAIPPLGRSEVSMMVDRLIQEPV